MKKTKFLALSLVVALGLTGTAFAYWGQDIASNTTVNTGKLEVAVQNPECRAYVYGGDNSGNAWDGWVITDFGTVANAKNLVPAEIRDKYVKTSVNNNIVTANVANMYPGSKINVVYDVLNTGSIPVKIKSLTVGQMTSTLADHYNFEVQIINKDNTTIWNSGKVAYSGLQAELNKINTLTKSIDPQEKVAVSIFASFDKDVDDANLNKDMHENESFTFAVTTGFTQFNAN